MVFGGFVASQHLVNEVISGTRSIHMNVWDGVNPKQDDLHTNVTVSESIYFGSLIFYAICKNIKTQIENLFIITTINIMKNQIVIIIFKI